MRTLSARGFREVAGRVVVLPLRQVVPGVELFALGGGEPAEWRADVLADRDALPAEQPLERRLTREPLDERAQLAEAGGSLTSGLADDGDNLRGKRRGKRRDRSPR